MQSLIHLVWVSLVPLDQGEPPVLSRIPESSRELRGTLGFPEAQPGKGCMVLPATHAGSSDFQTVHTTAPNREAGPLHCFPVGLKPPEAAFHTLILSWSDWIESYVQRKENISLFSALVYIPVYNLFLNISFETLWNNIATQLEHDRLYKSASPHVKQILFILVYNLEIL